MPHRRISVVIANQKVVTAGPGTTVREAARMMSEARVGAILVVRDGRLVGIFTERDALNRVLSAGIDPDKTPLSLVMTADPVVIDSDRLLGHALHLMHEGGFRHMPVVDDGKPVGMVSARDAMGSELLSFESELKQRDEIAEKL